MISLIAALNRIFLSGLKQNNSDSSEKYSLVLLPEDKSINITSFSTKLELKIPMTHLTLCSSGIFVSSRREIEHLSLEDHEIYRVFPAR